MMSLSCRINTAGISVIVGVFLISSATDWSAHGGVR